MKKHGIIILIIVLILTLCACGKSKKVQEVDDLIAAIGEISLNSSAAVEAAENAVAELSNRQRNQLENREILESARSALSDLQYIIYYNKPKRQGNISSAFSLSQIFLIRCVRFCSRSKAGEYDRCCCSI